MKRPRPDPAALERARQAARDARVKAGLPPDAPGDAEYEELQAQRKRKRLTAAALAEAVRDAGKGARARTICGRCGREQQVTTTPALGDLLTLAPTMIWIPDWCPACQDTIGHTVERLDEP